MLSRKTLFVIGAGASQELSFPMSGELSQRIAQFCDMRTDQWGQPHNPQSMDSFNFLQVLLDHRGRYVEGMTIDSLVRAAKRINQGLLLKRSIDSFIHQCRGQEEIAEIGKALIAKFLIEAEQKSALAEANVAHPEVASSWLHQLGLLLFDGLLDSEVRNVGENMRIISFNYDRNIEHYLSLALKRTYALRADEAASIVRGLSIVHPYGSLGDLSVVEYGKENVSPFKIAANIRTFSETVDSDVDEQIKSAVRWSDTIVYLGFSFGSQNMELLSAPPRTGGFSYKNIYASAFMEPDQSMKAIKRKIFGAYSGRDLDALPTDYGSRTFLEQKLKAAEVLRVNWHNLAA